MRNVATFTARVYPGTVQVEDECPIGDVRQLTMRKPRGRDVGLGISASVFV